MKLCGSVEGIIYRNEENGYTIFVLSVGDSFETVTGTFPLIREGDFVQLSGEYIEHSTYGQQFKATDYEISMPQSIDDIEMYLASGIIKGVGPKVARDIVDAFGDKSLEMIETSPEKLCLVKGIGRNKAQVIYESFSQLIGAQKTVMFLQKYGIAPNTALKIFSFYGENTVLMLKDNPYSMVRDIEGIGFLTADRVAQKLGFEHTSTFRLVEGVRYCLVQAENDGHTYLPQNELVKTASSLLGVPEEKIEQSLFDFAANGDIIIRNIGDVSAVYHPSCFYAETFVAGSLLSLMESVKQESEKAILKEIESYEKSRGIVLAEKQKQAAILAINSGICVITGGPGTGKTTTLDCILNLFHRRGLDICLAAPTGRAAKRMSDATGEEAKTIHRLLEYTKTEHGFVFKKNKENTLKCDAVILDEASMVDIFLMQALLDALKKGTRLILVGDADQLPSVGAGDVLNDIISSQTVPVVELNEIFRQAAQSLIVVNAHRINNGEMPLFNKKDGDFFLLRTSSELEIAKTVVELCSQRLPKKYELDAVRDIQVLTPIKKGVCGVFNLNKLIQQQLNPKDKNKKECVLGENVFRQGDKVIQIRNNYDRQWTLFDKKGLLISGTGVFNGDCGIIKAIDFSQRKLSVEFDDHRESEYEFSQADELNLAFAMSVHKSQGCEFPFVVMPIPKGNIRIMTRNLFYTAVTRAKQAVILCGSEQEIYSMVNNTLMQRRYSALSIRLKTGKENVKHK